MEIDHTEREPGLERIRWHHYIGVFLLSLATLLELALTRVLSVALWYHFGFLIISMALLGFGASHIVLALSHGLRKRLSPDRADLIAMAFVMPVLFAAALGLPLLWHVALAVVLLAPLGMLLGILFPTGLRIVAEEASALVPWALGSTDSSPSSAP